LKKKSLLLLIIVSTVVLFIFIACLCAYLVGKNIAGQSQDTPSKEDTTTPDASDDSFEESDVDISDEITQPQKYAVVASGASHDDLHSEWFKYSTREAYDLLLENDYTDENIYFLFEDASEKDVDFKSTYENFVNVLYELQDKLTSQDQIVFFLIGHGVFDGTNSYYELIDYSISDTDFAYLLAGIERTKLIVVFSPCNTGGFVDDLSNLDTVVITSTRADEANQAAFIEPFLSAFRGDGDENGDGAVSFAEAFNYATSDVAKQYVNRGWGLVSEHPQLDDNGDFVSHEAPVPNGGDGKLASETFL
jgi:hypothetical protein